MPNPASPIGLGLFALIALGCTDSPSTSPTSSSATTSSLERNNRSVTEVEEDLDGYTFAQKEQFVAKTRTRLDDISRDLTVLSLRMASATRSVDQTSKSKLQALQDDVVSLRQQLDRINAADASTWDGVKLTFKKGYAQMKDGVRDARQWTSDVIAP